MLAEDPFIADDIAAFGKRLRCGSITAERATRSYLDRIAALDGKFGAYEYVAADAALATARAIDALLAAGCDLGPLMGVPIAIKDLLRVDEMPVAAGTRLDVDDLIGPEGPVVTSLRRAGCIILGKAKTVEFALGITGVSEPRGTPWNPSDPAVHRIPGGSSSGSAVAVAAGLCAFAIGSDTGGSVRVPAALNGVFGLKTSFGRLSNAGVFPLAPHLDTIGLLTRCARDAEVVFTMLTGNSPAIARPASCLRLGRPATYFFDGLNDRCLRRVEAAIEKLRARGAMVEPVDMPEAEERETYFPNVVPTGLIASLGRTRVSDGLPLMDPVVAARIRAGFEVDAILVAQLEARRNRSIHAVQNRMAGFDAWLTPTVIDTACPVLALEKPEVGLAMAMALNRNTQPANYLDLCAISIPLVTGDDDLPFGFQLMAARGQELELLATAIAIEDILIGDPLRPGN
jgi:aspartyl-tRNA(Asn)/glutamyl-tRNA(Gln) amidotransferase subunit A